MKRFKTLCHVERDHPAYALGYKQAHMVVFQPGDDDGGARGCVSFNIPEGLTNFDVGMDLARSRRTRVLFVCDTRKQAEDIAKRASASLPNHRRVSLERASMGEYGPAH